MYMSADTCLHIGYVKESSIFMAYIQIHLSIYLSTPENIHANGNLHNFR